ncbi:hypothetical protein LUZ60_003630 [Juncus effusus]|nr:hypothetical protein LUZ60_003630 [Juncus effusus]
MGKIRSFFRRRRRSKRNQQDPSTTASTPSPSSPTNASGASPAISSEEELERVFNKFDSNGDGRICRTEMAAIFESLGHPIDSDELDRMMEEADADGDGFVSLAEFGELMTGGEGDEADEEEELKHAFQVFDVDQNGAISAEEIARVLRGLGEAASVAQCRKMIDGVDRDGDGMVSFEEFKVMMANGGKFGLATRID